MTLGCSKVVSDQLIYLTNNNNDGKHLGGLL